MLVENPLEYARKLGDAQKIRKQFDLVRTFTVKAGEADNVTIPLSDLGSFEQVGYNISHGIQEDGTAPIKLRFRSESDNAGQSNDLIPIELISTPGRTGNPRYGMRPFAWFYPTNDVLTIDWDGRSLTEDVEVSVVLNGFLYLGG